MTMPLFSSAEKPDDPASVTGSIKPATVRMAPNGLATEELGDHLGTEDMRRATGAMALALDPQGNGSPVNWDNAESRSAGRFTPVGGPFLKDDEVCRAFLAQISTLMDKRQLQGTACRPSGGIWAIRELKPWRAPA